MTAMTLTEQIITIAIVVFGTVLTRALPFIIFSAKKPTPAYVKYLGKVLPAAVIGLLAVYSLRNVDIMSATHAIPEAIAVLVIVLLHWWKRNMLLSIAGGTVIYMLLVQLVFI